jgi:hypothetical protein
LPGKPFTTDPVKPVFGSSEGPRVYKRCTIQGVSAECGRSIP